MPTYEYQCENCNHEFEQFQSIISNPLKKCPECKKMKLNRLIGTGGGIIFKGSGFYETDYRSENYKEGRKNAKPKTESKGDDKKDTKKTDSSESKDTSKKESKKPDKK